MCQKIYHLSVCMSINSDCHRKHHRLDGLTMKLTSQGSETWRGQGQSAGRFNFC